MARAITWIGMVSLLAGILLAGVRLAPFISSRLYPTPVRRSTPLPPASPIEGSNSSPALLPLFEGQVEDAVPVTPAATATPADPLAPTPIPVVHIPTRIVIPAIDLDAPVVTTGWEIIDVGGVQQAIWLVPAERAAGWHESSASLGIPGNTVLNGHNTTNGEVFRDLYQLEPENRFVLFSDDVRFEYEVEEVLLLEEAGQSLEVRLENARYIQPTQDERVTLITCHPYASLRYRLVVIGRRVATEDLEAGSQED